MKIEFIQDPPLKKVIIKLSFSKNFELKVSETAEIYERIKNQYPIEPNMALFPPVGERFEVNLGTLRFSDSEKNKSIGIGQNFIIFTTNKYSRWENLRNESLEVLLTLNEIIKFSEIVDVLITYVDVFKIEKSEFIFKNYFNIMLQNVMRWDIDFSDFHLGLVPYRENNNKIVLRINSRKDLPENYIFNVETVFITRKNTLKMEREILETLLDNGHDKINSYFAELIYNTLLHSKIGMKVEE